MYASIVTFKLLLCCSCVLGGVIAENPAAYRTCLQDFKSHFVGYICGINKILSIRDGRRVESFRAQIPDNQTDQLKNYLNAIPKTYVKAAKIKSIRDQFDNIRGTNDFKEDYERISGKSYEEGYDFHHIIPIELNGSNEPWNFIQLSQEEHTLFTNFIRYVIPFLQGRTLGGNGQAIKKYIEERYSGMNYKGYVVSDLYLDWIDLRHKI